MKRKCERIYDVEVKFKRSSNWTFFYRLCKEDDIYICEVYNILKGISETSFYEAIQDAKLKLLLYHNHELNHLYQTIKSGDTLTISQQDYYEFILEPPHHIFS